MATNVTPAPPAPASVPPKPTPVRVLTTLLILFGLIAVSVVGLFLPTSLRLGTWIGILTLLALFVMVAGRAITGRWLGLFIDDRNKMSLSRFQIVLWSVLIFSAFLATALTNLPLVKNPTAALNISIPPEILTILGISTTSLVGAPLILNNKPENQVDRNGPGTNDPAGQPSWFDMFKGDDTSNANYLDLSKVQLFYSTLILALVYALALGSQLMVVDPKHPLIDAFPAVNATIVGLFGISHAGYLTYKAAPHTSTH